MKFITKNFSYKLAAGLISTLFWYFVQGEELTEITKTIDLNYSIPDGYATVQSLPRTKDITISGPRVVAGEYQYKPLEADISLPARSFSSKIRVTRDMIYGLKPNIRATIHDPYIKVKLDKRVSKRLFVKEIFKGLPADGYNIEKVVILPESVEVTGARANLSQLNEVYTLPININNITKNFTQTIELNPIDGVNFKSNEVKVSIQVGEKKINNKYNNIAIEVVGSEYFAASKPKSVNIVIQGTPSTLQFIESNDLQAVVQARDLKPGSFDAKVQVRIPSDTVLIETVPETVKVEIYNRKK